MYYGEMTAELEILYEEYEELFGVLPDFYVDIEYGPNRYEEYVRVIKKAIKEKKEIPYVVPYNWDW